MTAAPVIELTADEPPRPPPPPRRGPDPRIGMVLDGRYRIVAAIARSLSCAQNQPRLEQGMVRSTAPIWGLLLISLTGCPSASVSTDDAAAPGEDASTARDARAGTDALGGGDALAADVSAMDGAEPSDAGLADLGVLPDPVGGVGDAGVVTTPITLPYNGNLMGPPVLRFSTAVNTAILVRAVSGTAMPGTLTVRSAAGPLIESFSFFEDAVGDQRYVPIYLQAGGDDLVEVDTPPDRDRSFLVAIEPITTRIMAGLLRR